MVCEKCSKKNSIVKHPRRFYCRYCGLCKVTCQCRNRPQFRGDIQWATKGVETLVNSLIRPIGLEFELSEFGTIERYKFQHLRYHVERDGSVQPSEKEMVAEPLFGDKFISAMVEFGEAALHTNAKVNDSCGFHVHVGATDFNYWMMRRLFNLYSTLENDIYTYLLGPKRRNSEYCRPLNEAMRQLLRDLNTCKSQEDMKIATMDTIYGVDLRSLKTAKDASTRNALLADFDRKKGAKRDRNGFRYLGFNLHSWIHRGTVEFRHKEGTLELSELINWPLFCGWMVDTAARVSDMEVRKISSLPEFTERHTPAFIHDWVMEKIKQKA
jgi:hypothetical protein